MFTDRERQLLMEGLEATISVLQVGEWPDAKIQAYKDRVSELRTLKKKIDRLEEGVSNV